MAAEPAGPAGPTRAPITAAESAPARPSPSPALPPEQPPAPQIWVQAPDPHAREAADLLRGFLATERPDVQIQARSLTSPGPPCERADCLEVTLETDDAELWRLHLRAGGRSWFRSLPGPAQDPAALEAAVAIIARAAAVFLTAPSDAPRDVADLDGWQGESTPEAPASPSPAVPGTAPAPAATDVQVTERSPAQSSGRALQATLGLAYRGQYYAPELPWTSAPVIDAWLHHRSALSAHLAVAYFPPATVSSSSGSFAVSRLPVEVGVGLRWVGARWQALVALGGLLEVTSRGLATQGADLGATTARSFVAGGLSTSASARWHLAEGWAVNAGLGLDALFETQRFVAEGTPEALLSPGNFRPKAELGLVWTFLR